MKRWQRILCALPFVFWMLSNLLMFVPLTSRVERVSDDLIRVVYSNFLYDYYIFDIVKVCFIVSIFVLWCFALFPDDAWRKARRKRL